MSRAVDFLRPQRPPQLGWVLFTLGTIFLAAALWCEQRWAAERAAVDQANQQAQEQATAIERALRTPPPPREPTLIERRWLQAQPELHRPWLSALRAIESATVNPVFLLSMNIDPAKGLIRLDAEAPSFDHALAYVQMLDESGALQPAELVSHERAVAAVGAPGTVRFSVVTQWTAP